MCMWGNYCMIFNCTCVDLYIHSINSAKSHLQSKVFLLHGSAPAFVSVFAIFSEVILYTHIIRWEVLSTGDSDSQIYWEGIWEALKFTFSGGIYPRLVTSFHMALCGWEDFIIISFFSLELDTDIVSFGSWSAPDPWPSSLCWLTRYAVLFD